MILQVQKICKSFAGTPILTDISLQLESRERAGLVGVNGAGKSTLLKLITGQSQPDSGQVHLARGCSIGYLEQSHGLTESNSIWQELLTVFASLLELQRNITACTEMLSQLSHTDRDYEQVTARYGELTEAFDKAGGFAYESRIRSVLHGMGFAAVREEMPVASLSGGQKTRLALTKLLLRQPDLLVLDEPTNHLDIPTLEWLESFLRAYPGALLIVSHDRYFLDAVVEITYELERAKIRRYVGNYSAFLEMKAARNEQERKQFERQQEQIARMEDFIQRNIARASTTKRAQSRRKQLEQLDRMEKPQGELRKAAFSFEVERASGKDVLHAEALHLTYDGTHPVFRDLRLSLRRGESVALIGGNGVGKTSLLHVLVGRIQPSGGTIRWGAGVKIGYYDQEQRALTASKTILDEVWDAFPNLEEARVRSVLGHFLFSGEDAFKKISALSGGEKARVTLAKLMLQRANVLVLDEPTNHLDVHSKEVLEEALFHYEGTLLFISHDRYFMNRLAERVLELTPEGLNETLGDYDDYSHKKQQRAEQVKRAEQESERMRVAAAASPQVPAFTASKQAKRDERAKQRRLEQVEQEIEQLETAITQLEQQLLAPERQRDYVFLQETTKQIDEHNAALAQKYELWHQLME